MGINIPLRSRSYSQFLLQLVVIWLLVCSHYNYHYGAQAKLTQAVLQKLLSPDNASIDLHDFTKLATKGISGEELEFLVNNQAQKIWAMTKDPTVISKAKEILDYSRLSVVYLSKIVPAKVVFLVGAALVTSMECAVVLNQVQHIDSFLRHNRNELAAIQAVIEEVEKVHIHPMKEMLKGLNMRMGAIELLTIGKEFNQHASNAKSTLRDVERRLRTQAELLHKEKTEAQTSKKRFSKMSTGALVSTVAGGLAVFAGMASPYLAVLGKAFLYGGVSTGIFSSVMRTSSDLLQGKTEFMLDENGKLMDKTIKDIREVDALQADFSNLHSKIYLHHDDYKSAKEMNMVLLISCVSWVSLCLFLFCRKKIQQTAVTLKNHIFRNTATAHVARPRDARANIRQVLSWVAALLATLVLALVVLDFGYKYHVSVHNSAAQEQNRDDFRKIFAKEKYEEYCRFVFIPAHRQLLMQYLPFIFGDATTNTEGYLMNDYCTNLRLSLSETSNINYIKKIGHIQGSYIHAFFREVAVLITDVLEMIGSNTSFDTKIWVAVFLMPSALFAFLGYFLTFVTCTVPAILKKALFGL